MSWCFGFKEKWTFQWPSLEFKCENKSNEKEPEQEKKQEQEKEKEKPCPIKPSHLNQTLAPVKPTVFYLRRNDFLVKKDKEKIHCP